MAEADEREGLSEETFQLIERHRQGDPAALHQLVERYYPRVRRIVGVRARARLLALTTVDDIVQDVFLRVLEGLEGYQVRGDARWIDWVARVAEREITGQGRYHRAQKRSGQLVELVRQSAGSVASSWVPADTTAVDAKVAGRELEELVDRCLSALSEAHREVILLRDYAGDSWSSIAETMGRSSPRPAGSCAACARRARRTGAPEGLGRSRRGLDFPGRAGDSRPRENRKARVSRPRLHSWRGSGHVDGLRDRRKVKGCEPC